MSTGAESWIPSVIPQTMAAAQALQDKLDNACATTAADADAVSAALDAVGAVIDRLNQEDMLSRDSAMQAAAGEMQAPLKTLTQFQAQLGDLSKRLASLAGAVTDVTQVLNGCRTIFGLA